MAAAPAPGGGGAGGGAGNLVMVFDLFSSNSSYHQVVQLEVLAVLVAVEPVVLPVLQVIISSWTTHVLTVNLN